MSAPATIRALVEDQGFEYRDGTFWTACPWCPERTGKDDGKRKLTIRTAGTAKVRPRGGTVPEPFECSPERAVWNCFRCKARGVDDFSWLLAMAPSEALLVAKEVPEEIPPRGFQALKECPSNVQWGVHAFLERRVAEGKADRNVWPELVAAGAGVVHGLGSLKKYRGRVVIPACDPPMEGHEKFGVGPWLGFVARDATGKSEIPFLTPKRMPREKIVMGVEDLLLRGPGPVYLVEGAFDRLALFPYGEAFLGKEWQAGQIQIVAAAAQREGREVVPCLDGDAPNENRALEAVLRGLGVRCPGRIELPVGADPGQLGWKVLQYFVPQGQ
jgi:hypothetical protein